MAQANMYPGVLFETKLTGGVYTHYLYGYNVLVSESPSIHQGGVALFFYNSAHWKIKAHQYFFPHILCFQMVMVRK